jgi:hypothetical protein
MMATPQVGLFGGMGTPEEMQRQLTEQKALQFAQMTPQQQTSYNIYKNTGNLGRGLAGAFGVDVQDPAIKRATMLRQLASQFDTNTPEGLRQMAQALQATDPELGFQVMQRADALELSQAKIGSEQALIKQREREKAAADPLQKLLEGGKYTPASVAAFQRSGKPEDLVPTEKPGGRPEIKKIGVQEGTREPVYTYQEGNNPPQQVSFGMRNGKQEMYFYTGGVDQTTAKVSATATSKGADEGAKTSAELDARRVNAAQVASDKAIEQADVLQQLLKTPQPISGTGAPARVAALRVFSTVGLTSPKDNEALSNADKFNSLAGERVLTFIKTLGTNPTDSDREFARTIGPALEKGTKTNQDLANYLLKRARETTQAAQAMEEHYYNNNYSLRGYKSPFLSKLETSTPTAGMSADELAKAAGGKIVNGKFVKD